METREVDLAVLLTSIGLLLCLERLILQSTKHRKQKSEPKFAKCVERTTDAKGDTARPVDIEEK